MSRPVAKVVNKHPNNHNTNIERMTSWPPCWCLVHQSSRFSYVKKGSHAHPPDTPQRLGSKTSRLQNASVQIAILKTVRGVFAPE